jgi:hypothetical protein
LTGKRTHISGAKSKQMETFLWSRFFTIMSILYFKHHVFWTCLVGKSCHTCGIFLDGHFWAFWLQASELYWCQYQIPTILEKVSTRKSIDLFDTHKCILVTKSLWILAWQCKLQFFGWVRFLCCRYSVLLDSYMPCKEHCCVLTLIILPRDGPLEKWPGGGA